MAEVEQSCRTCTFLHAFTPNGKRRAVKGQHYRCDAPLPMPLAFPESPWCARTLCSELVRIADKGGAAARVSMAPEWGTDCPAWELYVAPEPSHSPRPTTTGDAQC